MRATCVERDGQCRAHINTRYERVDFSGGHLLLGDCEGVSEWAHMHERRRSKTRNQAPEVRHDTKYSLMLCTRHHAQYDGRERPRLFITALTRRGADGPLKFRRQREMEAD